MSDSPAPAKPAAPSLASRITRDEPPTAEESTAPTENTPAETPKTEIGEGGTDGAPVELNGSDLRDEVEFDVEVKLIDMQGDPNSPLYSIKRFEDLNL